MDFDLIARSSLARMTPRSRPENNMLAVIGDSRVAFGKDVDAPTDRNHTVRGPQFWTAALTNARVRFPLEYDYSAAGSNTQKLIEEQLVSVLSCPASGVVMLTGTNDITTTGRTLAQSLAAYRHIFRSLLAAGKLVFVFAELPQTGSVRTTAQRGHLMAIRSYLKYTAPAEFSNAIVVDAWPDMADASVATIGSRQTPLVMRENDHLHPGPCGAYFMGKALADAINAIYPSRDPLAHSSADQWDASANPYGCINENPAMLGTGGTILAAGGGTMSGPVADSYYVQTASASDVTGDFSKTTSADGQTTRQRLVLSGTPSSTNPEVILEQYGSTMLSRIAAGDALELFAGVSCGTSTNLKGIMAQIRVRVDGTYHYAQAGTRDTGANYLPPEAWSGVLRTPRLTVPVGTLQEVRIGMYVSGYSGAPLAADIAFHNLTLRKVTGD